MEMCESSSILQTFFESMNFHSKNEASGLLKIRDAGRGGGYFSFQTNLIFLMFSEDFGSGLQVSTKVAKYMESLTKQLKIRSGELKGIPPD